MGLSVRLYVGGIPPGITLKELEDRFLPFGSVEQCEIIPPKTHAIVTHGAERQTVSYPRNFGFVSILPKDERSLQRAMSCYNGTRWRGSVMRCQVAKPTMMDKIAAEKINEEKERDEATRSQVVSQCRQLQLFCYSVFKIPGALILLSDNADHAAHRARNYSAVEASIHSTLGACEV